MPDTPPNQPPDSTLVRKVSVPALAGAITILCVVALHVAHVPITDADLTIGAPAFSVVLTAIGDIFLPARFLS